ncbi:MAG: glucuronate isomerase [Chitinophagaceae bacterium]
MAKSRSKDTKGPQPLQWLHDDFLLQNKTARRLYHDYAESMPIIDYHNHLSPQQVAEDGCFENITQAWLYGDHYKWRAMRTNGVAEKYCTGAASDYEKFEQWAATVPYTLRNPLYHWTHLELQRYFGVNETLSPVTSKKIYDESSDKLKSRDYSIRNLLRKMNVKLICTTDDPVDSLEYHQKIKADGFEIKVLPAFRPDKAMNVDDVLQFNQYVDALEIVADVSIHSFNHFLDALKSRHDYFAANGCGVSDHGLNEIFAEEYSDSEIETIFSKIRSENNLDELEKRKFKSAMLVILAEWDCEKNWVQQFHIGAMRNNNTRMMQQLGADTGWDSIGDYKYGSALSKFLNRLDKNNKLAKTIIYNLNPADNAMMATMPGNFNDGSVAGKIQWGAAWWFLDQKDGIRQHMDTLSNMGLLSRFVGMLTDSRSFLSFPRHEYFRRILCNVFGEEIENGELPNDIEWIGKVVQDICYNNTREYFGW